MKYINITDNLHGYDRQIDKFLANLTSEKALFKSFDKEMILDSVMVVCILDNDNIAGIAGLEKRFLFEKSYIMISKNYQGQNLGEKLKLFQTDEARKSNFNIIGNTSRNSNNRMNQLSYKIGCKLLGIRDGHTYFLMPLNKKGWVLYFLFISIFPLVKIKDKISFYFKK